jgi:hypothetical protein
MFSLPGVTWIGNAATVLRGRGGRYRGVPRKSDGAARPWTSRRGAHAVAWEQAGGPSREELLAEPQR